MSNKLLTVKENQDLRAEWVKIEGVCEISGLPLHRPVMDHCHDTGKVRGVLENAINLWEGKCWNAWKRDVKYMLPKDLKESKEFYALCLKNMGEYVLVPTSHNPYHPSFAQNLVRYFKRLNGADQTAICEGSNQAKRVKAFKALIKEHKQDLTPLIKKLKL